MHEDYKKRQPGNSDKNLIRKRTPDRLCIIDAVLFENSLLEWGAGSLMIQCLFSMSEKGSELGVPANTHTHTFSFRKAKLPSGGGTDL